MKPSRIKPEKVLQTFCNTAVGQRRGTGQSLSLPASATAVIVGCQSPSRMEEMLSARGVRVTAQRRAVLEAIDANPQCRNAAMIHRRARRLDPGVHRVTVYRTLALLRRQGMIGKESGAFGCSGREPCENPAFCDRPRIRCLGCGKAIEMGSCLLDDLTRCVERDCQFRVARASVDIEGYCRSCRT